MSCWEKQPLGSQQVACKGQVVPEMCPLPPGLPAGRASRRGL